MNIKKILIQFYKIKLNNLNYKEFFLFEILKNLFNLLK